MTSQEKTQFTIVGGPGKFELMMSLFDGNKYPRLTVDFQLEGVKQRIRVALTMVEQEDGSGESWNFKGWVFREKHRDSFFVGGYFSTKKRTGFLNFEFPRTQTWGMENGEWVERERKCPVRGVFFDTFIDGLLRETGRI